MAKTIRVHDIAKELGVDSKAIVAKCKAEGVPGIETHMSVVKVGLALTIKEWFSADHQTRTAVETSDHVDVEKAKKTRRKRAKAVGTEAEGGEGASATLTAEGRESVEEEAGVSGSGELETEAAADGEQDTKKPVKVEGQVEAAGAERAGSGAVTVSGGAGGAVSGVAAAAGVAESGSKTSTGGTSGVSGDASGAGGKGEEGVSASKGAGSGEPRQSHGHGRGGSAAGGAVSGGARTGQQAPTGRAVVGPAGKPNVPDRPTVVAPAGPRLVQPTQVQLKGPKVVRIEQPDVLQAPRRRGSGGAGGGGGSGGPRRSGEGNEDAALPGILRSKGPARGRGAGGPVVEEEGEGKPAGNKRRTLSTRRGRSASAELPSGPAKFTEADLAELDARLNRATGYVKIRRRELKKHEGGHASMQSAAVTGGKVEVTEPITIKSLSAATGLKTTDIIKYLFQKGVMATINSAISNDMAQEVAMEHEIELVVTEKQTLEEQLVAEFEKQEEIDVRRRPPVVTVMGHVDHGKTSLLDAIRKADVAAHEAGGITQHIGAYRVTISGSDTKNKTVVFLDTPGHEAFTTLRARGAAVTDVVVLVVAADDGVMPQTVESINHAKAAGVAIIVVLNKIDKPEATEANIRKIYGQLAEHGLNPTEWGGTTEVIKVSAVKGQGVTDVLEMLDYQAELLAVKADYGGPARGTVIEAMMAPGRGPVARVLVQQGTLRIGDTLVIGRAFGRVRDMTDDRGQAITEAGPATPVELSGMDVLCDAGDKFYATDSLQKAEEISTQFREKERLKQLANQTKITLENFAEAMESGRAKELRVVLKADVQGSVDVLRKNLESLGDTEVSVRVLHAAVGGVTESDVLLADASDAVIIGFNVMAPSMVRDLAEQRHVEIRNYRIIYDIADEVKKALEGMLEPETKEEILGVAEVRDVFKVSKVGTVAGCMVTEGTIQRSGRLRLARQDVVVVDNRQVDSLKRFKEDAKEVRAGMECGIKIVGFDDIKSGDRIVCYQTVTVKRKLGVKAEEK